MSAVSESATAQASYLSDWERMRAATEAEQRRARLMAPSDAMIRRYGRAEGYKCGECEYCARRKRDMAARPYKCRRYGTVRSVSRDWRVSWPACKLFRAKEIP